MNDNIKILVGISVLINAILIGYVIGYAYLFLFLSLLVNGVAVLYVKTLLEDNREMTQDLIDLSGSVNKFADHIEKVHSMEMFYGDAVLGGLLDHSQYAMEDIDVYAAKYAPSEIETVEIEGMTEFAGEEEETETPEAEQE